MRRFALLLIGLLVVSRVVACTSSITSPDVHLPSVPPTTYLVQVPPAESVPAQLEGLGFAKETSSVAGRTEQQVWLRGGDKTRVGITDSLTPTVFYIKTIGTEGPVGKWRDIRCTPVFQTELDVQLNLSEFAQQRDAIGRGDVKIVATGIQNIFQLTDRPMGCSGKPVSVPA